jgi:hypothetical protein
MLAQAVEAEVAAWIDAHAHLKDEAGRRSAGPPSAASRDLGAAVFPVTRAVKSPVPRSPETVGRIDTATG